MNTPPPAAKGDFQLLTEEEFNALTTGERIAYLKRAMEVRNRINKLIDAHIVNLPSEEKN